MLDSKQSWPKFLFAATLIAGVFFLIVSYVFIIKTSDFAYNRQLFEQIKRDYDSQISELTGRLIIKKTITQQIPTPVIEQQCTTVVFGQKVCVPVAKTVQREIKIVAETTDPEVQKKLDELKSRLSAVSAASEASQARVVDFKPFYEFVEKMMRPAISIIVMIASLYVILSSKYSADTQKWAFGSLGTVLGFWLK